MSGVNSFPKFSDWFNYIRWLCDDPCRATNKYRQIGFLKEAGVEVNPSEYQTNPDRINSLLYGGVVHKDKQKKYWVDKEKGDCFAIYPRGLNIDNSERSEYWRWTTNGDGTETAEMVNGKWLGVRGTFRTVNLLHRFGYKVSFQLKMTPSSTMKGRTVNLKLTLPDGTKQEKQAQLPASPDIWQELEVGKFTMTVQNTGEVKFSMEQLFEGWESGLIIKCVEIKPN